MAGVLSFLFLGEVLAPLQILGGVLVIGSIVLLQLKQEHDEKAPAVIRAKHQESKHGS
jgi:drug/metabolite transporter (DMT)-like permease